MAYGEKYKYYFYYDHDSSSDLYKVSFLKDGYVTYAYADSVAKDIKTSSFNYIYIAGDDNVNAYAGTSSTLNFMTSDAPFDGETCFVWAGTGETITITDNAATVGAFQTLDGNDLILTSETGAYFQRDSILDWVQITTPEVITLTSGRDPFMIDIRGQKDTINQPIMGSSASMQIIVDKSDVTSIDADFLANDYKDMIVKLIKDPDGTPSTEWVGFLLPSNADRPFQGYKYTYDLEAVDGIADLKEYYYTVPGDFFGTVYNGFSTMLSIIKTAISKMATFSDMQLDFRVQLGTYSDQMISTENALKENQVVQELFFTEKDNRNEPDTCYNVIEKILKPFNCKMAQIDGYYQIWCKSELDSYYFEYDWSTLTQQSRTLRIRLFNIFSSLSNKKLIGSASLSKIAGYKQISLMLNNKSYDAELLTNGGFDSNVTSWGNGKTSDLSAQWTTLAWYNFPGLSGTLSLAWSGSATAGSYYFRNTTNVTLTIGPGAPDVQVTVNINRFSETPSAGTNPDIRILLYNGTDTYITGTNGYQEITTTASFISFTETFDATAISAASNSLDVEVRINDASTTATQYYVDFVQLVQLSGVTPTDSLYRITPQTTTNKELFETDLFIADQINDSAEICSIKDAGGSYTSTWDRYDDSDTLPLMEILGQQILNDNYGFTDYVRCTVYDDGNDFFPNLAVGDLSFSRQKYYDVIGFSKNYREATVKVQMKDTGIDNADVALYKSISTLDTQYGETIN